MALFYRLRVFSLPTFIRTGARPPSLYMVWKFRLSISLFGSATWILYSKPARLLNAPPLASAAPAPAFPSLQCVSTSGCRVLGSCTEHSDCRKTFEALPAVDPGRCQGPEPGMKENINSPTLRLSQPISFLLGWLVDSQPRLNAVSSCLTFPCQLCLITTQLVLHVAKLHKSQTVMRNE